MLSSYLWSQNLTHTFSSAVAECGGGATCQTGLPTVNAGQTEVQQVLQIFFGILAGVAVLMIMIAGLRFITAQGNPQEISKARSTMLYAIAGLVIALIAEAIVSFVLNKLP